jgi:hypothetical protein
MSAKVLRPFATVENKLPPWQPSNSVSSGSDRHDFAAAQGLDIANWGPAKELPVLAIELARAFVADRERRTCRVQFTREHALPRGIQAHDLGSLRTWTGQAIQTADFDCSRPIRSFTAL